MLEYVPAVHRMPHEWLTGWWLGARNAHAHVLGGSAVTDVCEC